MQLLVYASTAINYEIARAAVLTMYCGLSTRNPDRRGSRPVSYVTILLQPPSPP